MRSGGAFFLYWAGADCCGTNCRYSEGRSARLLGPWQKHPANPILRDNAFWRCPGHGTPARDRRGAYRFLYHAIRADSFLVGRQTLLDPVHIEPDGKLAGFQRVRLERR